MSVGSAPHRSNRLTRVTMLGSGTSTGVPSIGCSCAVCVSSNPRNKRLRPSLRLDLEAGVILVDTSTDLRQQALTFGLPRVDAVLYTHAHADHVFGLDELRSFNFLQRREIPCFGSVATLDQLRRTFAYVFEAGEAGGGKPKLHLDPVRDAFEVEGVTVQPVPVFHGELEVFGYRIGSFAYVTDCSLIPESSFELLDGVEFLVLGALRYRPHSTHFTVSEAIEAAQRIGASRTYFTHISHEIDHGHPEVDLPIGIEFGYDGLQINIS